MSEEITDVERKQRMHFDVLSRHSSELFSSLIYESDLQSNNLKEVEFEKIEGGMRTPIEPIRGYFANKNRRKYFLDEDFIKHLPIRVGTLNEELVTKEDVVIRPLQPTPFKITPEGKMTAKDLIDNFAPFEHNNPPEWTLLKMISIAAYVSRIYVCVASTSSFGKSSVFKALDKITDKCPVFKPRSIPGFLNQINGDGNMIMDEVHDCEKSVKRIIEEFSLLIGDGSPDYINGALKSANTKQRYDCSNQSITFLYNLTTNYSDPAKEYWDFIFSNNVAMQDRFLQFRFDGELIEKFSKDFNVVEIADKYKMYYINMAKTLAFMQKVKQENKYTRKFEPKYKPNMTNRQRDTYDNITWVIDLYCDSQPEYDDFIDFLNESIQKYKEMMGQITQISVPMIEDTVFKEWEK